jgi:NDP-sugar pyrophosphorylase family protein
LITQMQCVILAGGLGTRMYPVTRTVPKTLLPVAGRPFASWQLAWLGAAGIDSVVYCIGHLGSMIRDHVGDGTRWGVAVDYVDEGEQLRGTAGAVRLALDAGRLAEDFLVLYGDSWLQVDPAHVLRTARSRPEPALMTVFRNDGRWDGSNVVVRGDRVYRYAKGLTDPPADMRWIDYGLLALTRDVIADRIPADEPADLAPLCTALADERRLAALEVSRRFYEIGSPGGHAELDALLAETPMPERVTP